MVWFKKTKADNYEYVSYLNTLALPNRPIPFFNERSKEVKRKYHSILVAALSGGAKYEEARRAALLETQEEMTEAEKLDSEANEKNRSQYDAWQTEMNEWLEASKNIAKGEVK